MIIALINLHVALCPEFYIVETNIFPQLKLQQSILQLKIYQGMGKKIPKQMKRRDFSGSYQNTSMDCFQVSNDESLVAIFSLIAYSFNSLVHPMSNPA